MRIAEMNKNNVAEILQKEMGITCSKDQRCYLGTTKITTCTLFWGYDSDNEIGFLCHFDWPMSVVTINELFDSLKKLQDIHELNFECFIEGGWKYLFWPKWTRQRIIDAIESETELNLKYKEKPYYPFFTTKHFSLNTNDGNTDKYYRNAQIRSSIKDKVKDAIHTFSFFKGATFAYKGKYLYDNGNQ